jgi:hypothetical protein
MDESPPPAGVLGHLSDLDNMMSGSRIHQPLCIVDL